MSAIDWTHLFKKYKGQWVALLDDQVTVVAAGASFTQAAKRGYPDPIFHRVPTEITYLIGSTA